MDEWSNILLSPEPLSLDHCYDFVVDDSCGGICVFVGTVRNQNKGEAVTHLDFESYESMAVKQLFKIATACRSKFQVQKIAIHHRVGKVNIKDKAVIIAISTIHRKEAFQACEYAIDQLKEHVPIWKKEFLKNGNYWVNARP